MDMMRKLYGPNPVLVNRGTIGTAMLNISDTEQAIDLGIIFDTAYKLDVISSNVADAAAGTGLRTLEIYGLDLAGNPLVETVILNGQTAVQTVSLFWRVFLAKIATSGTGRKNAGDIYIYKTGTGGTITAGVPGTLTSCMLKMLAGLSLATSGIWTAPKGTQYLLDQIIVQARVQAGRIQVYHAAERISPSILPYPAIDFDVAVSGACVVPVRNCVLINELEDIYFKATMTAAAGIVSCDAFLTRISPTYSRF